MNWLLDWRLWLFAISLIKDAIIICGIFLVKYNDLKHLSKDMAEIKTFMKDASKELNKLSDRVSRVEGKLE